MSGFLVPGPGHALDLDHAVLFDGLPKLRQKRLERFKGEKNRLVQGLIQACTGQGAGFLVPLGHVQLFIQGNQG
ncbi:hypothetical protein D3C80_2035120 [compost metagenome]